MTTSFLAFTVSDFPALNASLNATAGVLLLLGYLFIRAGRIKAHITCMCLALVTSAAFLACYLTYHYMSEGLTRFPEEYPVARIVYLSILLPHTVLAAVNLPMIILTVVPAIRERFDRHKRVARWTLPIWGFVSVTGVIVYMMLYQWFPPTSKAVADLRPIPVPGATAPATATLDASIE